jgi:hypothetical protein
VVSSGDTINIHDTSGAFWSGYRHEWFCADGESFFIVCSGFKYYDSGSQMPSVPTGKLIAKIGSTYYDVLGSTFVVPGGISNAPVQLEMNTPPSTDDSGGDVAFTVTICNNQAAEWTITLDFTTNPRGFVAGTGPAANWTPSLGWQDTCYLNTGDTLYYDQIDISHALTAGPGTHYQQIQLFYDQTVGTYVAPSPLNYIILSGTPVDTWTPVSGAGQSRLWSGDVADPTSIRIYLYDSQNAGGCSSGGAATLRKMVISGLGPTPTIS